MNIKEMTETELRQNLQDITEELESRRKQDNIIGQIDRLNSQYLASEGVDQGEEWRQPEGAHDAYPKGFRVVRNGKTWESTTRGNVWEPGTSGWREVTEDGDDTGAAPEFLQPTGAHDAYQTGERVTFEGETYESVIDGNVWSPTDNSDGWTLVDETSSDGDTDNEPEEPIDDGEDIEVPTETEPDEEPEPTAPDWKQPTGGHDAYSTGDRVKFEGAVYESTIDANTYSPTDYPQGWELIE